MISRTRDKLNEAQYFLNRMEETQHSPQASSLFGANAFRYDLNAFIITTRSVTYAMQKDFREVLGFNGWYITKQEQMRNDEIMKFFHEQRNITIHQGSVYPHGKTMITSTDYLMAIDSGSLVVTLADGTEEKSEAYSEPAPAPRPSEQSIEQEWFFDKFLPNNVLVVCGVQVVKLRLLVDECEKYFQLPT